jgi:hypothetical protein
LAALLSIEATFSTKKKIGNFRPKTDRRSSRNRNTSRNKPLSFPAKFSLINFTADKSTHGKPAHRSIWRTWGYFKSSSITHFLSMDLTSPFMTACGHLRDETLLALLSVSKLTKPITSTPTRS